MERFLTALFERNDFAYSFSSLDLRNVELELEVSTSHGRPDAVLWSDEDWFICWELKVGASEGDNQTTAYASVDSFRSIGLDKSNAPSDRHFYIYLAPSDAQPPEASEFIHVSWEWVASKLQSCVAESHGEYPARTTAQLNDFVDTIKSELQMTEYQENRLEKAKLYIEHYDEITAVQEAFDDQWETFTTNWGTKLTEALETAEIVEDRNIPDGYVAVDVKAEEDNYERWVFRQGMADWGEILKDGWWKHIEDLSNIYGSPRDDAIAGICFYHRLRQNRDLALDENILEIQLWHSSSNVEEGVQVS